MGSVDDRLVSFVDLGPQILDWMGVPIARHMHGQPFAGTDAPRRDYIYGHRDRIDEVGERQRAVRGGRFKYIRGWQPEVPSGHELAFGDNQNGPRERFEAGELNAEQRLWFEPVARERLYTQPIVAPPGLAIEVKSVRYGWEESDAVVYKSGK